MILKIIAWLLTRGKKDYVKAVKLKGKLYIIEITEYKSCDGHIKEWESDLKTSE